MFKHIKKLCYPQFIQNKKKGKEITFITDGLKHYKRGFNKHFRNVAKLIHGIPIAAKKYGLEHNNNCIERDHQYSKQRYKTMRGFNQPKSANHILNFLDIHYNYIDKQTINKKPQTPAQAANIKTHIKNRQMLLNLIKNTYDDN